MRAVVWSMWPARCSIDHPAVSEPVVGENSGADQQQAKEGAQQRQAQAGEQEIPD